MGRGSFLLGILLIWLALSVGELYRIRIELPRRPKMELGLSSLMVGMTDLAAALVVGAIGWACVWIVLAAQSKRDGSLCPKRTTFVVTLVAAGVLCRLSELVGEMVIAIRPTLLRMTEK